MCIFPEGQSHSEPHVRPFKDGAARIALGYLKDHPPDPHLAIIPVGLHFEHKDRLRTRVWVRFGEPIYVDDWKQANPQGDHRALTEDIEEGVRTVTLNFENQEARTLLHWTAEVFATGADVPPRLGQDPETLSQRLHVISQMQIRARLLREEHPENIQKLADQLEGFRRKLRRLAVTPAEVYLSMHPARAIFFILREAELTFVGLPLAVWGAVNHLPALLAVKIVERRLTKADDQWASNTFFAALAIFPIFFLIQLCIVAVLTPLFWTLVYAITVPFGGIYLTMYQDRVGGVIRRSRTFIYFLFHRNAQKRLMEEGRAIVEEIRGLAELPEMT